MMSRALILLFSTLISFGTNIARSEIELEIDCGNVTFDKVPERYDRNGNGRLDVAPRSNGLSELDVFALHQCQKAFATLDQDTDGVIEPAEIAEYQAAITADPALEAAIAGVKLDGESVASGSQIGVVPQGAQNTPKPLHRVETSAGFLVRNEYHAASILSKPPKTDPASLKPENRATLSYLRDNLGDNNTFSARGAVVGFQRWGFFGNQQPLAGMTAAALGFGVEFDRTISSDDETEEVNALTFRLDGDVEFVDVTPFSLDYFKLSPRLTTDFDFESAQLGVRAEYSPVENSLGIGVSRRFPGLNDLPLEFRWQPTLRIEYDRVLDDGNQETLIGKDNFFFVGGVLNAQLFFDFEPLERFSIDTTYIAMTDFANDDGGFNYLEISANWALDKARHYSLSATYRTGREPKMRKEVDEFTIGVGIQF